MNHEETEKRSAVGRFASFVGIAVNLCLATGKIVLGALFGLISILADGLNNLTDCGSSVVSNVSFRLSAKPADKEHPFGHERIEYICSLVVAFVILLVAFETCKEAFNKITSPSEETPFSIWMLVVLGASILAKCGLYFYYTSTAKKIDSDILRATAVDSLTDCISTSVVLITLLLGKFAGVDVDGYASILVALFIAWSGIGILRETFSKLIGQAPDEEMLKAIKKRILSYPGVLGVHDLSVYSYGPNKYFASAHVEVDAKVDVLISHELVDAIERDFVLNTGIMLTGHLDPIVVDDECVNELRAQVNAIVKDLGTDFSLHDFRMVCGEKRTNVLFDIAIPYGTKMSKDEISTTVAKRVSEIDEKYCCIITVEYSL